jgi:phosphatidylglycerophosphatase C
MTLDASPSPALPQESCISADSLVEKLAEIHNSLETHDVILAFDADGTLWSGDVGNDLFHALVARRALRNAAHDALAQEAAEFGIASAEDTTDIAQALFDAHETGQYPEDRCFAMMAWAFAGMSLSEARSFSHEVVKETNLESRLHRFLDPVFAWANRENVGLWVVSASPKWMVEIGVAMFGIPSENVIGMMPVVENEIIRPKLDGLPIYGINKPKVLKQARPHSVLLGGFGDSSYDVPLLQMARLPVAIRPKPSLAKRIHEVPNVQIIGV